MHMRLLVACSGNKHAYVVIRVNRISNRFANMTELLVPTPLHLTFAATSAPRP